MDASASHAHATTRTACGDAGCSLPAFAALVVGLSFLWPCLGSSATMHFRHAMLGSASVITTDWHAVVMGALYLVAIAACLVARNRLERLLAGRYASRLALAAGAAGIAGHIMLVASPLVDTSTVGATALVLAGFALSIAFVVGHILVWGAMLVRVSLPGAILAVAASNALAFGVQLALDAAVGREMLVYLVVCPIFSAALWFLAARAYGRGCSDGLVAKAVLARRSDAAVLSDVATASPSAATASPGVATVLPDVTAVSQMGLRDAVRGLPWRGIAVAVVLIYFEQALTSLLFQRYTDWPRENLTVTLAVGCGIWALASAWLAWTRRSARPAVSCAPGDGEAAGALAPAPTLGARDHGTGATMTVLFSALLVVYMGALLATVVFPEANGVLTERFLVAAGSSFRVLLWIYLMCAVASRRTTVVVGYLAYVLFVLAIPVSRLASLVFEHLDAETIAALTAPNVIVPLAAVMLFLMAVTFVVLNARGVRGTRGQKAPEDDGADDPAVGDTAPGTQRRREAVLAAIAGETGLSSREAEVFALVCSGYSARHAGEKLGISESTVVSHVTHIYRKLGVSSRQELIALVDRRAG